MDRRAFVIRVAGAVAAVPLQATAQPAVPSIGFLRSTPATGFDHLVAAFRAGLAEVGFVPDRNVAVQYRWADNQPERLRQLAAELVRHRVAVIVANSPAAEAAKAVTSTIPIVFVTADDPVRRGLVASLGRPGGNVTGITFFGGGLLGAKRFELLHELVPTAKVFAFLMDPSWPTVSDEIADAQAAARASGRSLVIAKAGGPDEFESAFAQIVASRCGALLVGGSPRFTSARGQLVALAARHALPAIYDNRDFVDAGGLASYGGSIAGAWQQAGVYAGRILNGAKASELPVQQPTTFSLVVNLKAAATLGIDVPQSILLRAEELVR